MEVEPLSMFSEGNLSAEIDIKAEWEIKLESEIILDGDFTVGDIKLEYAGDVGPNYECYHCGFSSCEFKILKRHILREHLENELSFLVEALLGRSESECTSQGKKIYRDKLCPHCDYRPSSCISIAVCQTNLKRHIQEIHNRQFRKYSCNECGVTTKRKADLLLHIKRKHESSEDLRRFRCELCDYRSYRKYALNRHLSEKHKISRSFEHLASKKRALCDNSTSKHSISTCYRAAEKTCMICDYKTHDPRSLESHIRYRHSTERPFACPHCDHRAKMAGDLSSHIRSIHTKEKKYSCPHCDYTAVRSFHIKSHIRVHAPGKVRKKRKSAF